jgi:hypothetical protein
LITVYVLGGATAMPASVVADPAGERERRGATTTKCFAGFCSTINTISAIGDATAIAAIGDTVVSAAVSAARCAAPGVTSAVLSTSNLTEAVLGVATKSFTPSPNEADQNTLTFAARTVASSGCSRWH